MKKPFSQLIMELNELPYDQELETKIRKTMLRVAWLCKEKPSVKGNYSLLTFYYWRIFGGIKISADTFERIVRSPSPETIGRAYRKLVEKSQGTLFESSFLPTDKTRLKRRERQIEMRRLMPKI